MSREIQDAGPAAVAEAADRRVLRGRYAAIVAVLAVTACIYHLFYAYFRPFFAFDHRVIHWACMSTMGLMLFPGTKKSPKDRPSVLDVLLIAMNLGICAWLIIYSYDILLKAGSYETSHVAIGAMLIVVVLELGRRTVGWSIVTVALVCLAYALFGPFLPDFLSHKGYSLQRITTYLSLSTEGIFTIPLGVSAQFICLFILYGAILEKSGAGKFFTDIAFSLTGWSRSGPANASVLSSVFFGMISGSSVANTTTTGTFTIPLMKKTGYSATFAGAVAASASTIGQIMPPIMGAGAFIMAEFLRVPYLQVCLYAVIPALLAFFAVSMQVHFKAVSTGVRGIPKSELPPMQTTLLNGWHHCISLLVLVGLLVLDFSPERGVFWAILTAIACSYLKKDTRMSLKTIAVAFRDGGIGTVTVTSACAVAGIIIGTITMTGLGLKFTTLIMDLSMGNIYLALLLTAVSCLALGMGVPTTAAYIIISALAVPALLNLGVAPAAAHLFIFYYATRSDTTPPVALAAYAGAAIAGANPMKTGITAFWLGMAGYLIPFMFVFGPELMLIGNLPDILASVVSAVVGIVFLAAGLQRCMFLKTTLPETLFFLAAALLLIKPGLFTDSLGAAFGGMALVSQLIRRKRHVRRAAVRMRGAAPAGS